MEQLGYPEEDRLVVAATAAGAALLTPAKQKGKVHVTDGSGQLCCHRVPDGWQRIMVLGRAVAPYCRQCTRALARTARGMRSPTTPIILDDLSDTEMTPARAESVRLWHTKVFGTQQGTGG